jgi:glycosyltransferase involved in cell wall biosynthesis
MKTELRIIIPVYNEESRVKQSLKSIFDFYSHSKESINLKQIIVINDGSRDRSGEIIKELIQNKKFTHDYPISKIKYINLKTNIGKANAIKETLKFIPKDTPLNSLVKMQDSDLLDISWKHIANEVYPMIKNHNIIMSLSFVPGARKRFFILWRYEFAKRVARKGGSITGQRTLHFSDFKDSFSLLPKENNCYQLEPTISYLIHQKVKKHKILIYSFHLLNRVSHIQKFEKNRNKIIPGLNYVNQGAQLVFNYGTLPFKYFFQKIKRKP